MSQAQRTTGNITPVEKHEKAEEYEPLADWLMKNGRALGYTEVDLEISREEYDELAPLEKFQALTDFYNERREADNRRERYSIDEMLNHVELILESPESIESSQRYKGRRIETTGREDLEKALENTEGSVELKAEERATHRTGGHPDEPELEKVVWDVYTELEEEDMEYIGVRELE
ncbi:MAG: hypothetical protein ACI9LV_000360 [Candidatus Nanohaloarchaea archaeon]|jgi:hypothetical protein